MTLKKLSTGTFITLALATSLTFGLMSIHSAKAKTNLNTITASAPSAASLSAQISGVTVYFLGAGNNTLYVARPGSEVANKVGDIKRDRKSTRLNSSHIQKSRMPSSA